MFQAYVNAINNAKEGEDLTKVLLASKDQLVSQIGPQIVLQTTNKHKTIDSEDIELKYIVQPDGTLVTERKKTTKHEDILDEDLPDDKSLGNEKKVLKHKVHLNSFLVLLFCNA